MRKEDLEEVYRINRENFTTDAWSREAFEKEFKNKFSEKFVLEVEGKVVGYVVFWVIKDEATVMTFAVSRQFWGKGYGRLLLEESMKKLKGRVEKVVLDVRKSNLRAIRLYRNLGFRVVRERRGYYSDGENALMMELRLNGEP
ncbi:MAG: ribosomal protein S18-alanine N-acetyltransferase [Aquificae bacterium]|nr:ribosomal protein S18-alanine N-acetyltransferase [Aquificota bacterium]